MGKASEGRKWDSLFRNAQEHMHVWAADPHVLSRTPGPGLRPGRGRDKNNATVGRTAGDRWFPGAPRVARVDGSGVGDTG
jgi:hypothetical protein